MSLEPPTHVMVASLLGQVCPLLMLIRVRLAGDLVRKTPRGLVYKKGEGSTLQGQHKGLEWRKLFSPHRVAFLKSVS